MRHDERRSTPKRPLARRLRRPALGLLALILALGAAGVPAAAADVGAWIDRLEGGWYGDDNDTPMGRMGFGLLFERQEDGGLRAFSAANRESWIELHFFRGEDGRWMLKEGAALEGLGERGSVLEPAASEGDLRRWVDPENPDYLAVEASWTPGAQGAPDRLYLNVLVHGRAHATFQLERVEGEQLAQLRESFRRSAELDPAEHSIYAAIGNGEVPPRILQARAGVATYPDEAERHLELARAIGAAIDADPAAAPRYAMEMLQSLQQARALDPELPEVYEWLAGYYMQAPPIAGGSLDKAREMATTLGGIDAERGRALMAQVEAREVDDSGESGESGEPGETGETGEAPSARAH